jgi:hypothetical protein
VRPVLNSAASLRAYANLLGGEVVGSDTIIAPGPNHSRKDRSLSVRFSPTVPCGFLTHSFAGDRWQECRDHVSAKLGLRRHWKPIVRRQLSAAKPVGQEAVLGPSAPALRLWRNGVDPRGTLAERYLVSRGVTLSPLDALRFHKALRHPSGEMWPAMVALVTNGADGTPMAVHRTFLARDGRGKAPDNPQKMMWGPCRGGAVRLANPGETLMVGEGIETCLAAMQASGRPAWAALSTSGLRALELPKDVGHVIVLADGDEAGEAAAGDCALRLRRQGRRVRIARPPHGMDFNDMLLGRVGRSEGDRL